jgi:hypothetical protein
MQKLQKTDNAKDGTTASLYRHTLAQVPVKSVWRDPQALGNGETQYFSK